MLAVVLTKAQHVRRYSVAWNSDEGWRVVRECDGHREDIRYQDWHRVERALDRFTREIEALERDGWSSTSASLAH